MQKTLFKQILTILDEEESDIIERKELYSLLWDQLTKTYTDCQQSDIFACIDYLIDHSYLKQTSHGLDLTPNATIFAKAPSHSTLEAFAFFACLHSIPQYLPIMCQLSETAIAALEFQKYFDQISYAILTQTTLISIQDGKVRLRKENMQDIHDFLSDAAYANNEVLLLSPTLLSRYIAFVMKDADPDLEYKNQSHQIMPYPYRSRIQKILPRRGIPTDRNATRHLQSFYKDTLYHEYSHQCPICGINIPHMLIASHIKPFRDCAHLYEAVDHHNGILLCRNHDFLFDQGYISFSEDGKLLISDLLSKQKHSSSYAFDILYQLPEELTTCDRRMFLSYHREHIFKG